MTSSPVLSELRLPGPTGRLTSRRSSSAAAFPQRMAGQSGPGDYVGVSVGTHIVSVFIPHIVSLRPS